MPWRKSWLPQEMRKLKALAADPGKEARKQINERLNDRNYENAMNRIGRDKLEREIMF